MIRHVSVLTFVEGVTDEQIHAIESAIGTLPERLPIAAYAYGRDVGLTPGNQSFGVVADFENRDDFVSYRDDPEHQRMIAEIIRPVITARNTVQYEFTP